ncbi:hypothetical protein [Daejeonella lutea]|nr:hypothetical protein [Daejeonella lutea]
MSIRLISLSSRLIFSLGLTLSVAGFAYGMQDTISQNHRINYLFNNIYRENVIPGFFGNEYGNPIKTSLVADVNPNVILVNTSKSRFFVLFSPRVKLRLLEARKAPVRSPSYMPGLKIYSRINSDTERPQFLALAYSHHSNGQDGTTLDSLGQFNRGIGKFTTNYYTLDYTLGKKIISPHRAVSQYGSVGIELHTGLFNRGYSRELKGKYGFVRINSGWIYSLRSGKIDSEKYGNHHRMQTMFTYIADNYENYSFTNLRKRLNFNLQYSYQPGFTQNVAFALGAGYRGQDDYNIYFEDSYSYITIGVLFGTALDLRKKID